MNTPLARMKNATKTGALAAFASLAVVAGLFAGPAATASAAEDSCAAVEVVFARGTFEAPGVGATVCHRPGVRRRAQRAAAG